MNNSIFNKYLLHHKLSFKLNNSLSDSTIMLALNYLGTFGLIIHEINYLLLVQDNTVVSKKIMIGERNSSMGSKFCEEDVKYVNRCQKN